MRRQISPSALLSHAARIDRAVLTIRASALAEVAHCDERTAAKVLRGERVLPIARAAIEAAAAKLGIELPPPPAE